MASSLLDRSLVRMAAHLARNDPVNLLRAWAAYRGRIPRVASHPLYVQVGITSRCNLTCTMCYNPLLQRKGDMPYEAFVRLADAFRDVPVFILSGIGENFMHRDFLRMAALLKERGKYVMVTTNLTACREPQVERLVDLGIDEVDVSIDGWNEEQYLRFRPDGDFGLLLANLRHLRSRKAASGRRIPLLKQRVVLSRINSGSLRELVAFAEEEGIEELELSSIAGEAAGEGNAPLTAGEYAACMRSLRALRPRVHLKFTRFGQAPMSACRYPYTGVYVAENGEVLPCCWQLHSARHERFIFDRKEFGNACAEGAERIWSGEAYRGFRETLAKGDCPAFCRGCIVYREPGATSPSGPI